MMNRLSIPESWRNRVLAVADLSGGEIHDYLDEAERRIFDSFRFDTRRIEWGASRVAAKLLAVELGLCTSPIECAIPTHSERPKAFLSGGPSNLVVSISHSGGAGAAAFDRGPVGIDLQEIQHVHPRTTKYFLNDEEHEIVDDPNLDSPLIHLWSAKEAVWKVEQGEGWYRSGRVSLVERSESGLVLDWARHGSRGRVETRRIDDRFVLAMAWPGIDRA